MATKKEKNPEKYTKEYIASVKSAAQEFIDLRDRKIHPEGDFDNGGRWYPTRRFSCCSEIRNPSSAWPFSLLIHCRTAAHVAENRGVDVSDIRSAVKKGIEVWALEKAFLAEKNEKARQEKIDKIVNRAREEGEELLFV